MKQRNVLHCDADICPHFRETYSHTLAWLELNGHRRRLTCGCLSMHACCLHLLEPLTDFTLFQIGAEWTPAVPDACVCLSVIHVCIY